MRKALSWLDNNLEECVLLILLGAMSIVMMAQILMRYIFHSPMPWAEEFCRYCFVFSGTLSAGYCLRRKVGIRVDLVINILPPVVRILFEYLSRLLTLALYAYLFYYSFGLIQTTTSVSPAMQIPVRYIYSAFPIGFGLGTLRSLQDIVLYTAGLLRKSAANGECTAIEGGKTTC